MVLSYPIDEMKADLKAKLSSHRHGHTESVLKTAMHYANQLKDKYEISDEEISKLEIAALLHDICKELHGDELLKLAKHYGIKIYTEDEASPNVLHARVGAAFVEDKYEIYDPMILDTIREHTLGSRHMTTISKILYLADYIEPLRDKDDKEKNPEAQTYCDPIRDLLNAQELDKALVAAMDAKINHVMSKGGAIHPLGVEARNALI